MTKILGARTPHELWTGKRPNLNYLRKFGIKVHFLNKIPNKGKFSPRGILGILVGYSEASKAYRVWRPDDRKIHIARDIKFTDEYLYPKGEQTLINRKPDHIAPKLDDVSDDSIDVGHGEFAVCNVPFAVHEVQPILAERDVHLAPLVLDLAENNDAENAARRGSGRPRKGATNKPIQPSKQYVTRSVTRAQTQTTTDEFRGWDGAAAQTQTCPEDGSSSSEDDTMFQDCVEIAMLAAEVPLREALSGPNEQKWCDAIYSEVRSLILNDAFKIVKKPAGSKIVKCRTVLTNKYDSNNNVERQKARIVAKGFTQRLGIDYFNTFAPVTRLSSLRLLMALAAKQGLKISQLDIENDYLNGPIDTEVYMETPEMLSEMLQRLICEDESPAIVERAKTMLERLSEPEAVCKLNKALYGLRQSGRQWLGTLNKVLRTVGLIETIADPCVYTDRDRSTLVRVYVDDILIFSKNQQNEQRMKETLSKAFRTKDLGEAKFCLGIEIHSSQGEQRISQRSYIKDVLQRFNMNECKPVGTPLFYKFKVDLQRYTRRIRGNLPLQEVSWSFDVYCSGHSTQYRPRSERFISIQLSS